MKATSIQIGKSYEIAFGKNVTKVKVKKFDPKHGSWICETESGKSMSIKDAKRYNISVRHFRKLVDNGTMPKPMKLGRCSRWMLQVLEEYESKNVQKLMRTSHRNQTSVSYRK